MNRSGGYSSSSRSGGYSSSSRSGGRGRGRGSGRQSWQIKTSDSSSDFQSPVRADTDSVDRKPNSLWQVKGHDSDGIVSQKNEKVTPVNCHRQHEDSPTFWGKSSVDSKPHSSWKLRGHTSDGVFSQNNANVIPAGRHGLQQDHSVFRGESHFHGGKAKQWIASSKASSTADSGDGKQPGLMSVEEKVPKDLDSCVMESVDHLAAVSRLSLESAVESSHSDTEALFPKNSENERDHKDNEQSDCSIEFKAFDICPPKSPKSDSLVVKLKPPLHTTNREKRNEMKRSADGHKGIILRPGMVLLKSYLSSSEQENILRICRSHGLGSAGFYQPAYREGGKLHLKMMCFGEFWDPETSKYGKVRPMDQANPPSVPSEFLLLVDRAMKFSHSLIAEHSKKKNVEDVLPPVYPDICLVNYYARTGRLGLHQDKDESRESLAKGIPIVSFSIGDSAEFLYGDQREAENAEKVILESGDVLIFGGKSRHIFHGVSKILPDSAPKSLLESTNFLPGRLNLTFRQHT